MLSIISPFPDADSRELTAYDVVKKADNRDDSNWLYLPALQKVKRIASSDKSNAFMGSDFTYSDMKGVSVYLADKNDLLFYPYRDNDRSFMSLKYNF